MEIGRGSSDATCPVVALETWLKFARIGRGPLFRRVVGGKKVGADRLADKHVARLVKRTALAAGMRGDLTEGEREQKFSGHSLRAGLASSAEVDERYVQKQLGHASAEMTRRYQRRRDRFRVNLTKAAGLRDSLQAPCPATALRYIVMLVTMVVGGAHMAQSHKTNDTWTVAGAKARLSEVIARAQGGPQTITRNGKPSVIVVSAKSGRARSCAKAALRNFCSDLRSAAPSSISSGFATSRATSPFELSHRHQRPVRSAST